MPELRQNSQIQYAKQGTKIKKFQNPSGSLNIRYPSEITDLFMQGKYKEFEEAKRAYDNYYGKILPEVEVTASKATPIKTSNWTSEHNIAKDNKKYEQAHQAESQKIASAVSNKMNEVGNQIGSAALEIGSSFTPLWMIAPAIRTDLDINKGNYANAALTAGLSFAAPYALGKYVIPGTIKGMKYLDNVAIKSITPYRNYRVAREFGKGVDNTANMVFNDLKPKQLFRYNVFRGGKHPGSWYTTDRFYAKQYGDIKPYIIEAKNIYPTKTPLIEHKDPVNQDMFISNIIGSNPTKRSVIIGKDLKTNDIPYQSKGVEFYSLDPNNISLQNQPFEKSSLKFLEKPSKLTEAERLGIPKGERSTYMNQEDLNLFKNQINEFAKSNKYPTFDKEVFSQQEIERFARDMINRHNSFYRGVNMPWKKGDLEIINKNLGPNATNEEILQYMATHPKSDPGTMFITPYPTKGYGYQAIIQRPYKLGNDRLKWIKEGDFVIRNGNIERSIPNDKLHIINPWNEAPTSYINDELLVTKPMIFRGWAKPDATQLSNNLKNFKKGGSINIKEKNKGSFTKYCKGKVTEECIRKGKNSPNPKIRKKATFAANVRKWKHQSGGVINYINLF